MTPEHYEERVRRREALKFLREAALSGLAFYSGKTWVANGEQIFTDRITAFRFSKGHHIDNLPEVIPDADCPVSDCYSKHFEAVKYTTAETPLKQSSLELAIEKWEAKGKPAYVCTYTVGVACYNAIRLLEALRILGVDEAVIKQCQAREPAHIVTDGRVAIIAPYNEETG